MARLAISGAEIQRLSTTLALSGENPFISAGTVGIDGSNQRTGVGCFSFGTGGANYVSTAVAPAATARNYYGRAYIRISANPGAAVRILAYYTSTTVIGYVQLETNGTLTLRNAAGTQIGSATEALTAGSYYRVELRVNVPASGGVNNGTLEMAVDGAIGDRTSTTTQTGTTVTTPSFRVGQIVSVASNMTVYADDIAVNDDQTGGSETGYPGDGRVVVAKPTADAAVGTGWLNGGTAGTNLWDCVDNVPPSGVAAPTGTSQIQNATSITGNSAYDATLQTYTVIGVKSDTPVKLVQGVARLSGSSTTGTNNATGLLVSNPADAGGTVTWTAAFDIAAGTDPTTGWQNWYTPILYSPSVTLGTGPVLRVNKVTAATRNHMADFLGLIVEFGPHTVTLGIPTTIVTALPLSITRKSVGKATETDAAQAVTFKEQVSVSLSQPYSVLTGGGAQTLAKATETDQAKPLSYSKTIYKTLGIPTQVSAAQALSHSKTLAIGTATQTSAAKPLTSYKTKSVGNATQVSAAQALSYTKTIYKTLGVATQTSAAQALSYSKTIYKTVGTATQTSAAKPLTATKTIYKTLGTATQASAAQPLSITGNKTLGVATEADAAKPLSYSKTIYKTVTKATETDQAQALSPSVSVGKSLVQPYNVIVSGPQNIDITKAVETDTAVEFGAPTPITPPEITVAVVEIDVAQALTPSKTVAIGKATQPAAAQALSYSKTIYKAFGNATESDSARTLTHYKTATVSKATGFDLAQGVSTTGGPIRKTLGNPTETDTARPLLHTVYKTLGTTTQPNSARPLSYFKAILKTVANATETDTARALSVTHTLYRAISKTTELDQAKPLDYVGGVLPPDTHPALGGIFDQTGTGGIVREIMYGGDVRTSLRGGLVTSSATRGGIVVEPKHGGIMDEQSTGGVYDDEATGGVVL